MDRGLAGHDLKKKNTKRKTKTKGKDPKHKNTEIKKEKKKHDSVKKGRAKSKGSTSKPTKTCQALMFKQTLCPHPTKQRKRS